jgi:hypothetical protein
MPLKYQAGTMGVLRGFAPKMEILLYFGLRPLAFGLSPS